MGYVYQYIYRVARLNEWLGFYVREKARFRGEDEEMRKKRDNVEYNHAYIIMALTRMVFSYTKNW